MTSDGRRICIVSEEFAGSSGIAVAMRGLALHLVDAGYDVDVLISDMSVTQQSLVADAGAVGRVLCLHDIARADRQIEMPVDEASKSYAIYRYLKANAYAIAHFHDVVGLGYYAATARRQGLLATRIVTHAHGPSAWQRRYSLEPPDIGGLKREAIERRQLEWSDLVLGPDQHLFDGLAEDGVRFAKTRRLDWILPSWVDGNVPDRILATPAVAPGAVREIIFLGRQDRRSGLEAFVEALRLLPADVAPDVAFLGPFDRIYGEFSGSFVTRRLPDYRGRLTFLGDPGRDATRNPIGSRAGAMCVAPSLDGINAIAVAACAMSGIPIIVSNGGHPLEPNDLAGAIAGAVRDGLPARRPSFNPARIRAAWSRLHEQLCAGARKRLPPRPSTGPKVSVCLVHHERPRMLLRALAALDRQDYRNFEVIVSDDGSSSSEAKKTLDLIETNRVFSFPITILRSKNRYLGAARNAAARAATGEYLLFHDDDNVAEPHEISQFVASALASRAEVLTAQNFFFDEEPLETGRFLHYPLGIGGAFSFFHNLFGDANALFKRSTFEALGGFSEHYGLGWEDWELFLKAHLRGCAMSVVPEALFWYRTSGAGMLNMGNPVLNQERLYAMVAAEKPALTDDLLRLAQADHVRQLARDRCRAMLLALPHGERHVALMEADPNGPDARRLFLELLAVEGRDGCGHAPQASDSAGPIVALRAPVPAAPIEPAPTADNEPAQEAVLITGWAGRTGRLSMPRHITVGGVRMQVLGVARFARPDVASHLGRAAGELLGFSLLAVPGSSPRAGALAPLMRAAAIGRDRSIADSDQIAFLAPPWRGLQCHADSLKRLRLAGRISVPTARTVDVQADSAVDIALLHVGGALQGQPSIVSPRQKRLRFGPGEADLYISADVVRPVVTTY